MRHFDRSNRERGAFALMTLLLAGCYLALRLPRLRDMPVFTDEATYARWGQLVAEHPWRNAFVSMIDAKLPVHYWLLALTRWLSADPILAGRLLSVIVGLAMVPAFLALGCELRRLGAREQEREQGLLFGAIATALVIGCPMVATMQRMALAEPLLLLEATLLGLLSLRVARLVAEDAPRAQRWQAAALLGVAWGITLLTKQNFSYALWILPVAAFVVHWKREDWLSQGKRFVPLFALATVIGLAMFVPALFTDHTHSWMTRIFYKPVFRNHSTISPFVIAWENLFHLVSPRWGDHAYWWPYDAAHPLQNGWFYVYMTPPVFALAGIGACWMGHRGHWRPLLVIGAWSGGLLVPIIIGGGVIFPRYTVVGMLPLVFPAAWIVTDAAAWMYAHRATGVRVVGTGVTLASVLAWPAFAVGWSAADWRAPALVSPDVEQYLTRPSAGIAAQQAVAWLKADARRHPITILTGSWVGLPNDYLWLTFQHDPRVHLYWFDSKSPLRRLSANEPVFELGREQWDVQQKSPTRLDMSGPVYFLCPAERDAETGAMQAMFDVKELGGKMREVTLFSNLPDDYSREPLSELRLMEFMPEQRNPIAAADAR